MVPAGYRGLRVIRVQQHDFDPGIELERLRSDNAGRAGAVASFIGLVRDLNDGDTVREMTLEHYPGMTEKTLATIEATARERWELTDVIIIHRIGTLAPDEHIVFVAAASVHRKQAFQACEYLIDTLKTDAPFWKKEATDSGQRWVSAASGTG